MGDHQAFERYFWFDNQIRAGMFPNATTLAVEFECDKKTAQRAIDFMRDRLHAPLKYDAVKRGYLYTNNSFELPSLWEFRGHNTEFQKFQQGEFRRRIPGTQYGIQQILFRTFSN